MKHLLYIIFLICLLNQVLSQPNKPDIYWACAPKTDSLYNVGNFRASIELNLSKLNLKNNIGCSYMLAQDYALLGIQDSAFYYLNKYIGLGLQDYRVVYVDEDFELLRKNKTEWNKIIAQIEDIYLQTLDSSMNKEYALKLFRLGIENDRYCLFISVNCRRRAEPSTEKYIKHYEKLKNECKKLIRKYGFPTPSLVGYAATYSASNILLTYNLEDKYYQQAKEAYEKGDYLPPKYYASLTDTWLEQNGKKQIYGTIWYKTEKTIKEYGNVYILYPVEDFKNLNEIRAEMGLSSIEEYLENGNKYSFEIHYIPDEYYNDNE